MTAEELLTASRHRFADWPNAEVPNWRAGVYGIWDGDAFIYVGMAGRGLLKDAHLTEAASASSKPKGLRDRLDSHARGRRSGDQFCVYVCDRLVVPTLRPEQLAAVGDGSLSLDALTRQHIRGHLSYALVLTNDGEAAFALERAIQRDGLAGVVPTFNPGRHRSRQP